MSTSIVTEQPAPTHVSGLAPTMLKPYVMPSCGLSAEPHQCAIVRVVGSTPAPPSTVVTAFKSLSEMSCGSDTASAAPTRVDVDQAAIVPTTIAVSRARFLFDMSRLPSGGRCRFSSTFEAVGPTDYSPFCRQTGARPHSLLSYRNARMCWLRCRHSGLSARGDTRKRRYAVQRGAVPGIHGNLRAGMRE